MSPEAKLLPEAPLLVLPSLAAALGLNEAIVLQQIHFRTRDAGWWRAGAAELRQEFAFWSEATSKRIVAKLRRAGLVEVRQDGSTDRTNSYRVDYTQLGKLVSLPSGQIDLLHRVNLASNRSDASHANDPIPIDSRKRNGKRGESSSSHFDVGVRQ